MGATRERSNVRVLKPAEPPDHPQRRGGGDHDRKCDSNCGQARAEPSPEARRAARHSLSSRPYTRHILPVLS